MYEVASAINEQYFSNCCVLNVIKVDDCGKRSLGEWLVDACITRNTNGFIDEILFAMESESNQAGAAFKEDFAKLIHLNARYKLYLSGLAHITEPGMKKHIRARLSECKSILGRICQNGKLFVGFWPSPAKREDQLSAWQNLPGYLDEIRMWEFDGVEPREVAL